MRNRLADHLAEILGLEVGQVNEGQQVGVGARGCAPSRAFRERASRTAGCVGARLGSMSVNACYQHLSLNSEPTSRDFSPATADSD